MNTVQQRWMVSALGLLLFGALCACIATGPGYDEGAGIYVGGYYEPYGRDYGGWGPRYHVAPPRPEEHRAAPPRGDEHRLAPPARHAYKPAPASRPVPSIPTRPHDHEHHD